MLRRIYEVDPLTCRECGSEMKIISFIIYRWIDRSSRRSSAAVPRRQKLAHVHLTRLLVSDPLELAFLEHA
jgi:hypothetical protein